MAQNDETDQHPGADATSPETGAAATPAPVESTDPAGEPAIALRSSLPMRKASTMPDLSRFEGQAADGGDEGNDPLDREDPAEASDGQSLGGQSTDGESAGGQAVGGESVGEPAVGEPANDLSSSSDASLNDAQASDASANDTAVGSDPDDGSGELSIEDWQSSFDAADSRNAGDTRGTQSTDDLPEISTGSGADGSDAAVAGAGVADGSDADGSHAHEVSEASEASNDSDISDDLDPSESHGSSATAVAAPVSAAAVASAGATNDTRTSGHDAESAPYDPEPETAALSTRASEEEARRRAAERDGALTGKPVMARVFQVLIAIFFPIMLLAGAIRAVTTPLFLWVEYHRPGFPADGFGFNSDDRMTYGSYTVDYILNWAPPRYLGELVNADGDQLFLDSEVGHMLDVKLVLVISFAVALAMFVFTIAACWHLARTYPGGVRRSLFAGALTTLVLMIALTVTAVLGWQTFFTQVHALFFADGTWTFSMDDTLIRLFPAQFWMDAAITVAALVLIVSVVTLILTWPTKARREKSRLAAEAARQRQMDSLSL